MKIKYAIGIILIIAGFGSMLKGSFGVGLLFIALGVLILPLISEKISESFEIWKNKFVRYGIYIALFLVAGSLIPKSNKQVSIKSELATESNKNQIHNPEKLLVEKEPIQLDKLEFWNKYDPIVKERVYKMIKEKDCAGLQQEFNTAADIMDKLQKTGKSASRNLDLMDFLNGQMKELNCYN